MITPKPASKANALVDEINRMIDGGINNQRLNEIEDEANNIQQYDFVSAKRLLGVIAGMRRDRIAIDTQFNAALKSGGRDPVVLTNYATALANVGEVMRAMSLIDEAVSYSEGDAFVLDRAINIHIEGFDVDGAEALIDKIEKIGVEYDANDFKMSILNIRDVFNKTGADSAMAAGRVRVAFDSILNETHGLKRIDLSIHDGTIFNRFIINDDMEKVLAAESAMLDAIASQPYLPVDNAIYFSCALE